MPTFLADYVTKGGRRVRERIDAIDAASVEEFVRAQRNGWFISAEEGGARYRNKALRVGSKGLLMALEAVTLIIEAGATIDVAMRASVTRVPQGKLRYLLSHIARRIEETGEVAEAFSQFPKVFPQTVIGLIRAHEEGGSLAKGFSEVCEYYREMEAIRGDVARGLFIPIVGILTAIASGAVIFGFTLPRYKKFVTEMIGNQQLNPLSATFFAISDFITQHPTLCIAILVLLPIVGWQMSRYGWVRLIVYRAATRVPVIGRALEAIALARLCKTYSALAKHGFRALDAFEMCERVVGHEVVSRGIKAVREHVRNNSGIGEAFALANKETRAFPHEFVTAVSLAEGNLVVIFHKMGEFYAREAKVRINIAISALEPTMVVLLGGFALLAGLAIMLPILNLIGRLSGM